jgi:large subunit ribosomal protein L17
MRGRKLGRNSSHRKAMFRNMACSLIRSVRVDEDDEQRPKVPGRIVTTLAKAKELRPIVEKLVTLARKAAPHEERAKEFATSAERNTAEWKSWRESEQWNKWNQAIAPAVTMRRRAFAKLRDNQAVDILFDELAERFDDRPGGYTRVIRLSTVRLGDAGKQALIEFVGERDRVRSKRSAPVVTEDEQMQDTPAAEESETTEAETAEASDQAAEAGEDKSE